MSQRKPQNKDKEEGVTLDVNLKGHFTGKQLAAAFATIGSLVSALVFWILHLSGH